MRKKSVRTRWLENTRRMRLPQSTEQNSYDLTETEAATTGCRAKLSASVVIAFSLVFAWNFCMCEPNQSQILLPYLGFFFFPFFLSVGFLCPTLMWLFLFCLVMFCSVLFSCYLLEAYSFLMRQKGTRSGWERRQKELGGVWVGEAVIKIYCIREVSIFNKRGKKDI